jgi:hypothetical protein
MPFNREASFDYVTLHDSLQASLQSNARFQASVRCELQRIAETKAKNRQRRQDLLHLFIKQHHVMTQAPYDESIPYFRPWKRRYFVNELGALPEPNEDAQTRQQLQANSFFHYSQPPFSFSETKRLKRIITTQSAAEQSLDWNTIAQLFRKETKGSVRRSPDELRLQHQKTCKSVPFTKAESIFINERAHIAATNHQLPDWHDIASNLQNRSAWDCLVAYQTKLKPVVPKTWHSTLDEFLLKYVAACGPQCVLDGAWARNVAIRLIPNLNKNHLLARVHQSLINPKYANETWSTDEERRLCVLLKVYSATNQTGHGALYLAGTHMARRSSKSVADKWNRALSPAYLTRPFTPREDAFLLELARTYPTVGWTELSERFFPSRHAQRLSCRFADLASDADVLRKRKRK